MEEEAAERLSEEATASLIREDIDAGDYSYHLDSSRSNGSVPPSMDYAGLGYNTNNRGVPASFYSNYGDEWRYTIPSPTPSVEGSPPPPRPYQTAYPPSHPPPKGFPIFTPPSYPTPHTTYGPYHLDPSSSYLGRDMSYPPDLWSPVILPHSTDRTQFKGPQDEQLALKKWNQAASHSFIRLPPEDPNIDVNKLKESIRKEFREPVRPAINLRRRPDTITEYTKIVQNVEHIFTRAINSGAEYLVQQIYIEDNLHPKLLQESSNIAKKILLSVDQD